MKDRQTRLMDMLFGWGHFLEREEDCCPWRPVKEPGMADAILALHQAAGREDADLDAIESQALYLVMHGLKP